MKVLVIDDSDVNLRSARHTLAGHDVTCCSDADEAIELLKSPLRDEKVLQQELAKRGFAQEPDNWWNDEAYRSARNEAEKAAEVPYWDVVLVDLLMPAPKHQQAQNSQYVGKLLPVGWAFVIRAALNGARYVALATAMNHHEHPASALMDSFKKRKIMTAQAVTAYLEPPMVLVPDTVCNRCNGTKKETKEDRACYRCRDDNGVATGLGRGKNWGEVLRFLLED